MKKKSLFMASTALALSLGCLTGCNLNKNSIVVWVGSESVTFYRKKAKEFLYDHPDFGYYIKIVGADTGSAAGEMLKDNTACGDIITVAHDNIGKLSENSYIAPIVEPNLLNQIDSINPDSFKGVIRNVLGNGEKDPYQYVFGAPYISQALFLYYDTRYVKDEEAETFEGLLQAAKRYDAEHGVQKTKSYTVTGTDGFNFSFSLLARKVTDGQNYSSLRLYEYGDGSDCYVQDNDEIAITRWMQRNYEDPNGIMLETTSQWPTDISTQKALSVIGGAWHYNSFRDAVTDSEGNIHMGCKPIPTFTLTPADVQGIEDVYYPEDVKGFMPDGVTPLAGSLDKAPVVGDVFRGGSFVDCKCFVINMAAVASKDGHDKYYKICDLIKYFSSKEIQKESFIEALNVPAFDGAEDFIENDCKKLVEQGKLEETAYLMAKAQTGMNAYGISQPFINSKFNTRYYSKGTPDEYKNCIEKISGSGATINGIREVLWRMEYVYKQGANASAKAYPESYPSESTTKRHGSAVNS